MLRFAVVYDIGRAINPVLVEGQTVDAGAAVANAVADALGPLGAEIVALPLRADRLRALIHAACGIVRIACLALPGTARLPSSDQP